MGDHMTKTQNYKIRIEENRQQITNMLSGADTHKRLNNINWLRHELSYTEPRTLFYVPSREQLPYLDYNSMKNLGTAYDYIIDNPDTIIDIPEICKLHSMLCAGTPIQGGLFRNTSKVLELYVNGNRIHAPESTEIPSKLNEIVYKFNNQNECTLMRAFSAHYDLIMLQPFDDFNKRTARLIMNWLLIQGGYRPIVFNQRTDKQKYKDAITAKAAGDTKKYTQYMYSCLLRTQNEIINLLKKSRVL